MSNVLAIAKDDSIFLASSLIRDPIDDIQSPFLERIDGNIGKPGIAMMIPPQNPMIKTLGTDTWSLVNHNDFLGELEDNFGKSSLHLSFTGYELPVSLGQHGQRDWQGLIVETLVKIYDRDSWIADLDVLDALKHQNLAKLDDAQCQHSVAEKGIFTKLDGNPTSIDCGEELLDRNSGSCVVRAQKNWLGRLGATALSIQLGNPTIVLPEVPCWTCAAALAKSKTSSLTEDPSKVTGARVRESNAENDSRSEEWDQVSSDEGESKETELGPVFIC